MSSMTDIIFLLLIFFMITSTMIAPNAIKVLLPQSKQQSVVKAKSYVTIDKDLNMYVAIGSGKAQPVTLNELPSVIGQATNDSTEMFVSLFADETVPYRNIVEVLNVANENHFKMVHALSFHLCVRILPIPPPPYQPKTDFRLQIAGCA